MAIATTTRNLGPAKEAVEVFKLPKFPITASREIIRAANAYFAAWASCEATQGASSPDGETAREMQGIIDNYADEMSIAAKRLSDVPARNMSDILAKLYIAALMEGAIYASLADDEISVDDMCGSKIAARLVLSAVADAGLIVGAKQ